MQESDFLRQITTVEELEPKASNCTKVLPSPVPTALALTLAMCPPEHAYPPGLPPGPRVAHSDGEGEPRQRAQVPPGHRDD